MHLVTLYIVSVIYLIDIFLTKISQLTDETILYTAEF